MKYKITKTDLLINNKIHSEDSEVELTKEQAKGIEEYLIPIESPGLSGVASLSGEVITETEAKTDHSTLDAESSTKIKKKTNTKRNKK